jgi:hypothetical protein
MPRNASGTYTLPLSPVEPNTVIESDWANDTLADIEATLSDSLSRTGLGGMTAPFRIVDGSAAAPSLSFIAEPSSGLFRQSSGVVGMSIQGVAKQTWNANGTTIAGDITLQGAVALPSVVTFPTAGGLWLSGGTSLTGVSIGTKGPPVAALEVNYSAPAGPVSILVGNSANNVGGGMSAAHASATPSFLSNSLFISPGSLNSPLWLGTLNGPTSYIGFMVNSVDKMRIDANGNIGIGMLYTTPVVAGETGVDIGGTTKSWLNFYVGGVRKALFSATGSSTAIGTHDAQPLYLLTGNTGRLIISALGDVGVGMTPANFGAGVTNFAIGSTLNSIVDLTVGGVRMASFSSQTAQTVIGTIANFPLALWTNSLERMVIAANGKVGIGGAAAAHGLTVTWTTAGNGIAAVNLASDVSSSFLSQRADNAGATMTMRLNVTVAGSITHPTLTTTAYNTSSDARLKRNIRPAKDVGRLIDNIPVVSFDWKADGIHVPVGLIAQDVHGVFPQAVHEGSSDVNEDPWMLDHSKMVPLLLKEIQSLRERVNALEH